MQLGLGYNIPELEVYSYVLLFPRSFGNFLSWYADFRPVAKNMLVRREYNLNHRMELLFNFIFNPKNVEYSYAKFEDEARRRSSAA